MAYGTYEDYKNRDPYAMRTMDFQDSDGDGTDDRDQGGAGLPKFSENPDYYTGGLTFGQGNVTIGNNNSNSGGGSNTTTIGSGTNYGKPAAEGPKSKPLVNFEEPKTTTPETTTPTNENNYYTYQDGTPLRNAPTGFHTGNYMEAHDDVMAVWNRGTAANGGEMSEEEKIWVSDLNKKYGTDHDDMSDFTQDQYAQAHYTLHGMNEQRALAKAKAKEVVENPINPEPTPEKPEEPTTPPPTQLPVTPTNPEPGPGMSLPSDSNGNVMVGDSGNTTTIGNENTFGDYSDIGNNNSVVGVSKGGSRENAKNRVGNYNGSNNMETNVSSNASLQGSSGKVTTKFPSLSGVINPGGGSGTGQPNDRNNSGNVSVGSSGNTTTIGNENTFGDYSNIGNNNAVTIISNGGSNGTTGMNYMQSAAAYQALNNNQHQRSKQELNGMMQANQAIDMYENKTGARDTVTNIFDWAGQTQNYWDNKAKSKQVDYLGDIWSGGGYNWKMPSSPEKLEDRTQEIAEGLDFDRDKKDKD